MYRSTNSARDLFGMAQRRLLLHLTGNSSRLINSCQPFAATVMWRHFCLEEDMGFNGKRTEMTKATHEGAPARGFDAKTKLYMLACTSMMSGDLFYEKQYERLERFRNLFAEVAHTKSGGEFLRKLTYYVREHMKLRTMPAIMVGEALVNGLEEAAGCAKHAWKRGDEHLETMAYLKASGEKWFRALRRLVAQRLNEMSARSLIKYQCKNKSISQRDAIKIVHPVPDSEEKGALFKFIVHGKDALTPDEKRFLPEGNISWEQNVSEKGSTKEVWTESIGLMGYMALLRNLRNIIESGVDHDVLLGVASRIESQEEVLKSKQLPFRFLSALRSLPHNAPLRIREAIYTAMNEAARNAPNLPGETLVLVDLSGSMQYQLSARSTVTRLDAAACLAGIFASRGAVDLWAFGTSAGRLDIAPWTPVGSVVSAVVGAVGRFGHGTNIGSSLEVALAASAADRVLVLTDMQSHDSLSHNAWKFLHRGGQLYMMDLTGYSSTPAPSRENVHHISGFSERVFDWILAVEEKDPVQMIMELEA
jgi:60 kDa SS-A/Ro ribonucleoprotein